MDNATEAIGHICVDPPLNETEIEYVAAVAAGLRSTPGQPSPLGCWVPCVDGCCLIADDTDGLDEITDWLRHLIGYFLKPGARASAGSPLLGFTFDHRLDGTVAYYDAEAKDLFAIKVTNNRVTRRTLQADPAAYPVDLPPAAVSSSSRTSAPLPDNVIDLATRRRQR
ncbi:hypothetical protein [Nocardioides speluncae]|uniref:hypothetical protein n=1 Tax=Nocardioides speluncae TaxID=2670337 RepID=UPI000D69B956|nr:hypothetical protein [Nocardioides speluncae]